MVRRSRLPFAIAMLLTGLVPSEGLRPSDSPTRSLARRFVGAGRSRGSLAALARTAATSGRLMGWLLAIAN